MRLLTIGILLISAGYSSGDLTESVKVLSKVSGILHWISESGLELPYVDWMLEKVDLLQMYVEAGFSLVQKLDPELVQVLTNNLEGNGRSSSDYETSWRYYVPSYVRKSKTKLRDEENSDDDLVGSYGHSHGSSYGGGGGGYGGGGGGGGYGGGGHGGGGYGGGGHGGGGYGGDSYGGGGGGYGGGGYGGGGHGGGGYGGGGYGGGGGGYGGGGGGYGGGGHGGGGYGGGGGSYDNSGKAFSILGGLSFLTFLGTLLYQLATTSAAGRSFQISDMNVPLHLSDFHVPADGSERLDQLLISKEWEEEDGEEEESSLDRMVDAFNTLWRAHRSGSFRCVQRRLCETLTDARNRRISRDPLIQTAMVTMLDWLGDYDAAEMADRTNLMMADGNLDCSALVPKCRSRSPTAAAAPPRILTIKNYYNNNTSTLS